ncbi:uncharacterized protein LOC127867374 [Dreissena polymorpha]|uniref:Uncharacterized protein n=1 Tax=Dreissena polymorpha TaxID=45954 RepID=A0A9D4LZF0_DREPO|nr:uncharacterized protein LOC127867374 [Dreissena polymorpha]KAH3866796.1 hypothetical protein DPMN_029919 [Dreissena polymorpha]
MKTSIGVYILQVLLLALNAGAQTQIAPDGIYYDYEERQSSSGPTGNAIEAINDATTVEPKLSAVDFGVNTEATKLKDNNSFEVQDKTTAKDDIVAASLSLTTVTDVPPDMMGINDTELLSGDNETSQQPNRTDAPHSGISDKKPIDETFVNHLFLEGHVFGRGAVLQNALHLSLLTDEYFSQQWYLSVRAVSMSYMRTGDGLAITDVQYVVTYGHYVIERFHVQRILSKPEVHRHLHHHLETNSLKEYSGAAIERTHVWEPKYTVALAVGGVVIAVMILMFVAAIVTKRKPKLAGRKKSPVGKGPCVIPRVVTDKRKLFSVDDGGYNNPAYNFNSRSVMDGEFCA